MCVGCVYVRCVLLCSGVVMCRCVCSGVCMKGAGHVCGTCDVLCVAVSQCMCCAVGEGVVWCAQHGLCVCKYMCAHEYSALRSSVSTEKEIFP